MQKKISESNYPLILFSFIYYCITVYLAWYINIWEDEVFTLNTSSGTLARTFTQSFEFELQPPVYFLLVTLWRSISYSILWARLFSVFIIFLTQIFLYIIVKKVTNAKIAAFTCILFLINPFTVFCILEIRLYALILLLSLILVVHFYNTYYQERITPGQRILFIIIVITAMFTQYYFGFLLVAFAVVLLLKKKNSTFFRYCIDMIIPLLLLLLITNKIIHSSVSHAGHFIVENQSTFSKLSEIRAILMPGRIFEYLLPVDFFGSKSLIDWIFRLALIILFVLSANLKDLNKNLVSILPVIIMVCVILVFFAIVGYMIGTYAITTKRTAVLFMPLFLILPLLLKLVKPNLIYYWLALFFFIFMIKSVQENKELYKMVDFKSLGKYIESNEIVNEPVFVYRNVLTHNIRYYYNGINELIPVPKPFTFDSYSADQWIVSSEEVELLNDKLKRYPGFFFVIDTFPLHGVSESIQLLLNRLLSNFRLEGEEWYNSRIVIYTFSQKVKDLSGQYQSGNSSKD